HGKNKEIQVGKKFPVSPVVPHITNGVKVNQSPHPRYNQSHYKRKLIDLIRYIYAKGTYFKPCIQFGENGRGFLSHIQKEVNGYNKRNKNGQGGDGADQALAPAE